MTTLHLYHGVCSIDTHSSVTPGALFSGSKSIKILLLKAHCQWTLLVLVEVVIGHGANFCVAGSSVASGYLLPRLLIFAEWLVVRL
jgi:hypothetical protein